MSTQTVLNSCIKPTSTQESAICDDTEDQIRATTIRIELHTWASFGGHQKRITTKSHATILDDKYLVTHNHYKYSLTDQVEEYGETKGYTGISLRATSGKLLIEHASLSSFSIVYEDPATLVFIFVDENGNGMFETNNLPSAQFADMYEIPLEVDVELAQIDWDGETAYVDWVRVDNISLTDDVP